MSQFVRGGVGCLSLAAAAQAFAQGEPGSTACGGDIVFYVDFSGSMRCVDPNEPNSDACGGLARIAQSILESIQALNPDDSVDRFKFTVYGNFDSTTLCKEPFEAIELLYPNQYEFVNIQAALVEGRPRPICLPPDEVHGLCPGDATEGEKEDWGPGLAYVSIHHPWTSPVCLDRKRWYIPITDESSRCGNPPPPQPGEPNLCDEMRADDPNTPEDETGPDRRNIFNASQCALRKKVRAHPIIRGCGIAGPSAGPGTSTNPDQPPGEGPLPQCTCNSGTECEALAAQYMTALTTFTDQYLVVSQWNDTVVAPDGTFVNAMTLHIVSTVLSWACTIEGCDSIDFNGDDLFPVDQDLIDFLNVVAGGTCSDPALEQYCGDIDFDNDCLFPTDEDVTAFLSVLAGGPCPQR